MKAKTVDVYFYVSLDQRSELLDELAIKLSKLEGVTKASINPRTPRLVDVAFNPDLLSGSKLVNYVKQSGYPAAMVAR